MVNIMDLISLFAAGNMKLVALSCAMLLLCATAGEADTKPPVTVYPAQ